MCFRVQTFGAIKVAKKDIKCWKMINADYSNAFSRWIGVSVKYEKGVRMPAIELKERDGEINEGYHSFKGRSRKSEIKAGWLIDDEYNTIIGHFIIPAGSVYYENKDQYVSETIILQ